MIFKGLQIFSGKIKEDKEKTRAMDSQNPYIKVSEELKKSAEDLKRATRKLQKSFLVRQNTLNKVVAVFNTISMTRSRPYAAAGKAGGLLKKNPPEHKQAGGGISESALFDIYRAACLNFIDIDKKYYFKLRNHSVFLCSMYKRHMGNLRYYDHEFSRLKNSGQYRFTEAEAFVANEVIQVVNRIGKEKFVREGHQALYSEICSKLLPKTADQ